MTTRQSQDWDPTTSPVVAEIALVRVTRGRVRRFGPGVWCDGGSRLGQHLCVALDAYLRRGWLALIDDPDAPDALYAWLTEAGHARLAQVTTQNRNGRRH